MEKTKNELFDLILKNTSPTLEIKRTIDYQQTMAIVEELINHETDLLKEFVEWYKAHLNDLVKYEKDLYADANNNHLEDHATFYAGEISMLNRLLSWIDIKLERFLEERENG